MGLLFGNERTNPMWNALAVGLLSGNEWNEKAANAFAGVNAVQQQNKTADMLDQKGQTELAAAVRNGQISGSDAFTRYLAMQAQAKQDAKPTFQQFADGSYGWVNPNTQQIQIVGKAPKPTNDYMAVGKMLYNKSTGEWVNPPAGADINQTEYGVTPVWMKDKDGNMRLGVPGKDGSFRMLDTPANMELLPGVNSVDTGTSIQQVDKRTGQPINVIPKDVAGQQRDKKLGEATADAQISLASARQTAKMVEDGVADLMRDPGLNNATGPIMSKLPTFRSNTARAEAKIDQLKGQTFMQARQLLKGGGQITDFEGKKAEEAYARLSTAQSKEDFDKALTDFNTAVQDGVKKLEEQAKGNFDYDPRTQNKGTPVTAVNPKTGERLVLQNGQWVPMK